MSIESREEIETKTAKKIKDIGEALMVLYEEWPNRSESEVYHDGFHVVEYYLKKRIETLEADL